MQHSLLKKKKKKKKKKDVLILIQCSVKNPISTNKI